MARNKKDKLSILFKKKGIYFPIYVILGLLTLSSFFMFYNIVNIKQNRQVRNDINTIESGIEEILSDIHRSDLGLRGFYINHDNSMALPAKHAADNYESTFDSLRHYFKIYGLDIIGLNDIETKVGDYLRLNIRLIDMISENRTEEVKSILRKDLGKTLYIEYINFVGPTNERLQKLLDNSENEFGSIFWNTLYLQIFLTIIGIPTLILIIAQLNKSNTIRKQLFEEILKNIKKYIFDDNKKVYVEDEKDVILELTNNLRTASNFINKISLGDYNIVWEGMREDLKSYNEHNLAGELTNMRDQMKKVKREDTIRIEMTEGISKFGEIVRSQQKDLKSLSKVIIKSLVKYISANQGGVFYANEDDPGNPFLERYACYAYDKQRHDESIILPGDGLLWQAYREQETIYMDNVPNDYLEITSGLGGASPGYLLIVPLKVNEVIMGIMELASFQPFHKYQIEFIEKVSEITASTVNSIKINEKTQSILEQSQEQAEIMRANEEEMMQNIEELQATQEELRRKELEAGKTVAMIQKETEKHKKKAEQLQEELEKLKEGHTSV